MAGPIILTNRGNFEQSGQLDWVSLSKSTFTFGLDVLIRLSKVELDPATVAIGVITCDRFVITAESQKRIYDALYGLKSFSSYGKLMWFGFGIKPIIKDLADSEHGMACVGLCACMSISYDSFFAAGVLRELCKFCGTPPNFLPSIHQWKGLVDICAGSISNSKFPILLEGLFRCVLPNSKISLHKPTSTEALAKAVGALADVTNGKLENITIAGGVDCIWLAAISEWLLSLDVEIRHGSGLAIYKSSRNDDYRLPAVTVVFISDNEQPIHLSKCYIVPSGNTFWEAPSQEQHTFKGGRSEWNNILADAFGLCFSTLVEENTRHEFALLLFHISRLTETCYQYGYGSMQRDSQQNSTKCSGRFGRFHFAHSSSRGQAFLAFAAQQLPELASTLHTLNQLQIEFSTNASLEDCTNNIAQKCACQWCCSESTAHSCASQPFCLELMAETIIMFLWILSATSVDASLKPSACGLRLLYMRQRGKFYLTNQNKRGPWKDVLSAHLAMKDIDILTAALMVFSGSDDTGPLRDENSSAVSRHGVCAFFGALEDLNLLPEEASTVKVIPGHIDFEGIKYESVCDIADDTAIPEAILGPYPTYKLLVQEIRQPGVIATAYKVSSNTQSYGGPAIDKWRLSLSPELDIFHENGLEDKTFEIFNMFHIAAILGREGLVEILIYGGANVDRPLGGGTALHYAAGEAAKHSGRTALQAAAEGGHLAIVERLLQEKADVNAAAAKHSGRTALQAAAEGGHLAIVERLLQEKADVNTAVAKQSRRTALQAAAGGGHLAIVERLLQEKADVNATAVEYSGRTALQAAVEGGHTMVIELLCEAGIKVYDYLFSFVLATKPSRDKDTTRRLINT
ncbi:hypothetical protein K469DRAFT_745887 [Zopfia rhizophila CBS 207.26]|uniref:Uncharacterized protein n=1 Tax=Zopfia rhizophila CBS 207.26 TaxID=1314779 RepID=A0A6A6EQT8_9PEZI|nr:hypothetical protein K469DRAFT_745887 [Zopfia rhizophila CBS 207.26]